MKIGTGLIIFLGCVTPSLAQDNATTFVFNEAVQKWTADTGIVVTSAGQNLAIQTVAAEVSSLALTNGADPIDAAIWTEAFRQSGFVEITAKALISKGDQGEVALPYSDALKASGVEGSFTAKAVAMRLERMPRIKVIVEPVPPRDYLIHINGEKVTVTDRGEYGVMPGLVIVKVTRAGKADCRWEGELRIGDEHPLNCEM
jgi:hypothetical protein